MDGSTIEVGLQISTGDGETVEELQLATQDLREELIEAGFVTTLLQERHAILPEGAKGTGSLWGDIAVAAVPVVLPELFKLLRSWKRRNSRRSFRLRPLRVHLPEEVLLDGDASDHDVDAFVELVLRGKASNRQTRQ